MLKSRGSLLIWSLFPTMGHVNSAWKNWLASSWIGAGLLVQGRLGRLLGFQVIRWRFSWGQCPAVHFSLQECKNRIDMTWPGADEPLQLLPGSSANSLLFPISRHQHHLLPGHQNRDGRIQSVTKSSRILLSNTTHSQGYAGKCLTTKSLERNSQFVIFPWCKSSHYCQFQVTNVKTLNMELGRDVPKLVWAGSSTPLHTLPPSWPHFHCTRSEFHGIQGSRICPWGQFKPHGPLFLEALPGTLLLLLNHLGDL